MEQAGTHAMYLDYIKESEKVFLQKADQTELFPEKLKSAGSVTLDH